MTESISNFINILVLDHSVFCKILPSPKTTPSLWTRPAFRAATAFRNRSTHRRRLRHFPASGARDLDSGVGGSGERSRICVCVRARCLVSGLRRGAPRPFPLAEWPNERSPEQGRREELPNSPRRTPGAEGGTRGFRWFGRRLIGFCRRYGNRCHSKVRRWRMGVALCQVVRWLWVEPQSSKF